MQIPVEGGTPELVPGGAFSDVPFALQRIAVSPDGSSLAVVIWNKEHAETPQQKIVVLPLGAGQNPGVRLIDPNPNLSTWPIFSHDGKTLLYSITENGVGNMWAQPISGGTGHQITTFSSESIGGYQLTPDHIFLGLDGDAIWMEAVDGLGKAHDRMKELAADFPGRYFIFCAQTHSIVATVDTSETNRSRESSLFRNLG